MNQKDRIIEFLKYLQIGQDKFEKKVGVSRGFVNKIGDSIRKTNMDKISLIYPELNIKWLLTGDGQMLLNQEPETNNPEILTTKNNNKEMIVEKMIGMFEKEIARLEAVNKELKIRIASLTGNKDQLNQTAV